MVELTTQDLHLTKKNIIEPRIKIDIYTYENKYLDTIQGGLIQGGLSISADSDVRRTINASFNPNRQFNVRIVEGNYLWLDKYVLLYIGFHNTVKNEDEVDMYFSIGAHPGFNCKLGDKLTFECEELDVVNEMIDPESILYDEKFPTPFEGKDIVITKDIFAKDALILSNLKSKKCTLTGEDRDADIEFTFGDCEFLGLWAKPGAPYVCIEPWCGVNDNRTYRKDVSEKEGIIRLPEGGVFDLVYTAEII